MKRSPEKRKGPDMTKTAENLKQICVRYNILNYAMRLQEHAQCVNLILQMSLEDIQTASSQEKIRSDPVCVT